MSKYMLNLSLLLVTIFCDVIAVKVVIEAESTNANYPKHFRSEASAKRTVYLHQGNVVTYNFCLIRPSTVTLENILTSNDGDADTMNVMIDDQYLKSFQSRPGSNYGQNWNVFSSSGLLGVLFLGAGQHTVSIAVVSSDNFGVEIDVLVFRVSDEEVSNGTFTCKLQCIDNTPNVTALPGLTQGKAVQRSYHTKCAEEDNVDIPIFNKAVKEYEITASPPLYQTSSNLRDKNTENCPFLTPLYWIYENVLVSPSSTGFTSNNSRIYFYQESPTAVQMAVTFSLQGRKHGHIDSEIGSTLFMTLDIPSGQCAVTISYIHRNGTVISFPTNIFTSYQDHQIWNIPDFTWKEDLSNVVFVRFESTDVQKLAEFRMERRYMGPDQVIPVINSELLKVEAIRMDFWWQAPESMEFIVSSTQRVWNNIAYFRIAQLQANGFAQTFVLYQDGNMRLLYPTPSQFDWIPFGTSVIIGQTKVDDFRPEVTITRVVFNPADLTMVLTYKDSSTTSLQLINTQHTAKVRVYDLNLKQNKETRPFATFRSMYVETGNSDSDNIVSDSSTTKRVLGGSWSELIGTTFFLYRRCESTHLTQSPDITLTITKT